VSFLDLHNGDDAVRVKGGWLTTWVTCARCGYSWVAVVEWSTRGKQCARPTCRFYDPYFVWVWPMPPAPYVETA
jgi:hypothetical protein